MSDQQNNENNDKPKGYFIMILIAVLVIVFFIKFVMPAMDKGTEPPSSILTGEVQRVP